MKGMSAIAIASGIAGSILWADAGAVDGKHVKGFVVTDQYRSGSVGGYTPACCECGAAQAGDIQLVTISNGAVSKTETIYRRSQGLGQYPTFDVEAKRVAFYRYSLAPQAGDDVGYASDVELWGSGKCPGRLGSAGSGADGGTSYVSIINRDGTGLQNLVALRDQPYSEMPLDWAHNNWIYYVNPKVGSRDDYRLNDEIRRVNVTTHADELVYSLPSSCKFWRRLELSRDGKYAGVQTYPQTDNCSPGIGYDLNGVIPFPPANGVFPAQICSFEGCNASLSPSGAYGSNYFAGAHTEFFLNKINHTPTECTGMDAVALFDKSPYTWFQVYGDINAWLPSPKFTGSESCEVMRWAANSDKWVLQTVYSGAGNSVAANWIDKTAILVTDNPKTSGGGVRYGNKTGDMWVDGGAENIGKWEDTTGVWHAIPGYTPTSIMESRQDAINCRAGVFFSATGSRIRFSLPTGGIFAIAVFNGRGIMIASRDVAGTAVLGDRELTPGVYRVVASRGKEAYRGSVIIQQ